MIKEEYFGNRLSTDIPHDGSIFWTLWRDVEKIFQETQRTRFIQQIGQGELDPMVFSGFIISDCYYCFNGPKGYDTCIDKMPTGFHKEFFQYKRDSFIPYNKKFPEKLHIVDEVNTIPSHASYAQAEFEKSVAINFDPIYFLLSKLPCEYFWPKLFSGMASMAGKNIYKNWMMENSDLALPYEIGSYIDLADGEKRINMQIAKSVYIWGSYFELANFASATNDGVPPLHSFIPLNDLFRDVNVIAMRSLNSLPSKTTTVRTGSESVE